MNAAVGETLATFDGDLALFASTNGLQPHTVGLGFRPAQNGAILARTEREVLNAYEAAGPAAPILVEYRTIPSASAPPRTKIAFDPALRVTVRFESIRVMEDGSWFSTPWRLRAQCDVHSAEHTASVPLFQGKKVDAGRQYKVNESIELIALPGDTLECTAGGRFADVFSRGEIAPGRSTPIRLAAEGRYPLQISGSGETSYRADATVEVRRVD